MTDAWLWWGICVFAVGWLTGVAFALAVWWRPMSVRRRQGAELRRLQLALEDSDKQLGAMYQQSGRMAAMLVDLAAKEKRP